MTSSSITYQSITLWIPPSYFFWCEAPESDGMFLVRRTLRRHFLQILHPSPKFGRHFSNFFEKILRIIKAPSILFKTFYQSYKKEVIIFSEHIFFQCFFKKMQFLKNMGNGLVNHHTRDFCTFFFLKKHHLKKC